MSSSWVTGLISTVLIVGTGGFFYAWYYQFSNDIAPDSVAGYVYAIAGTSCTLLATVLYTIHRRSRKRLMGQLNAALNWHIFLAIMGIAFIFMHSFGNFNAKTGTYALYSLIALIISGFVGRALDRIMPWLIAREVDKILTAEGEDRVESISRNLQFQAETWYHHPRQLMVEIRKVEQVLQREQFYRYVIHYWRILHVGLALLTVGLITWHLVYVGQLLMNAFMHHR